MAALPFRRRPPAGHSAAAHQNQHEEDEEDENENGTPHLADLLAPDALEAARDHVRLDGCYARTLALVGYPRSVVFGWLDRFAASHETLDLALHLQPQDGTVAVRMLSHRMVQLHSSRLAGARAGRLEDPAREVAYADCERLRDRVQRGDERVLQAGLYITVHAPSVDELEARTARVEALIGASLGHSRRATWQALAGFASTLPAAQDGLGATRTLDASSLATMFPFTAAGLSMDGGVLYGLNTQNNALVLVNAFSAELPNANSCVVATSGAGS